jgi:hypothetical protein
LIILFFIAEFLTSVPGYTKDCIPGQNYELIRNGDFELGDTLFHTGCINAPDYMRPCATYAISYNPKNNYSKFDSCADHTSGRGKMLVVNGDTTHGTIVWQQSIQKIKPDTDYEFSFWYTSVNKLKPAVLIVTVNGDTLEPKPIWLSDSTGFWQQTVYIWNSSNNDTVDLHIYDINLAYFGNDFAIDDISLMSYCRLQACAGQNLSTCKNYPVMLNGNAMDGIEPYHYKWTPATGLNNPNIKNPTATIPVTTRYILEVTDTRNCPAYDTITVEAYDEPLSTIIASEDIPSCPCQPVTLTAAVENYDYLWSTNDTTRSITVSVPGIYNLTVTDNNGCTSYSQFEIIHRQVGISVTTDTINETSGKDIQFFLRYNNEENLFDCHYGNYTAKIQYNASLLIPRGDTPFGTITNGFETITVTGDLAINESQPLNFHTLWGNAECTNMTIEEIKFSCDSVSSETKPGKFCLTDLCNAAGLRLFDSNDLSMMNATVENEVLNVEIELENAAFVHLGIYDYTGIKIIGLLDSKINTGFYEFDFPLNTLPKGLYFVTIIINGRLIGKPLLMD